MKLLHIDSSILGDNSASRQLSSSFMWNLLERIAGGDGMETILPTKPIAD